MRPSLTHSSSGAANNEAAQVALETSMLPKRIALISRSSLARWCRSGLREKKTAIFCNGDSHRFHISLVESICSGREWTWFSRGRRTRRVRSLTRNRTELFRQLLVFFALVDYERVVLPEG
jgi:hypothetical protein